MTTGVLCDDDECTITDPETGNYFDLRPLIRNEGEDWSFKDTKIKDRTYYFNVCRKVLREQKSISNTDVVGGYYEEDNDAGYATGVSIGAWTSKPEVRGGKKLVLDYNDGSACPKTLYQRSLLISFICDNSLYKKEGEIVFVDNQNDCTYTVEWTTAYACPVNKPSSHFTFFGVFATIIAVAVVVYIVGGVIYNRVVQNETGWRQIPNYDLWANAFDFIKDMIIISVMSLGNVFKRRTNAINLNNGSASRPGTFSRGFARGGYHDVSAAPDEAEEEDLIGIDEEH